MSLQTDPTPSFTPSDPFSTPAGLSLSDTFIKALTQPNEQTYQQIASDAPANDNKAYRWVFISTTISFFIIALGQLVFPTTRVINGREVTFSGSAFYLICAPVVGLLAVLSIAIWTAIVQWIARSLGGTGTYGRFRYTYAAMVAPMANISAVIRIVPIVSLLSIPLSLYQIFLSMLALKTVNQFGWGKALVATFVVPLVFVCIIPVALIVILAIMGPAIGKIFSTIVISL